MPKYIMPDSIRRAISDPVEFEFFGRSYKVDRLPQEFAGAVQAYVQNRTDGAAEMLTVMVGKREWDKAVNGGVDAREVQKLCQWLSNDVFSNPIMEKEKNASGAPSDSVPPSDSQA